MKHILLIEDDPAIADPLSYALAREQWQVVWHDTGIAALAALQAQRFDCIVLDVGLPDTDGFEPVSYTHLRAHETVLISRIKAVCRRSNETETASVWQHNDSAQTISYHGTTLDLTRYEYRLLRHLLAHPGKTFDRDQLVNTLWDHPDHIDNRTVDSHIKTLRQKLRAIAPDADPIRTRRGYGYHLEL